MTRNALIAGFALAATTLAPLAANAEPFFGHHHRGDSGRPVERSGRIASVNGGSFKLEDGTTIFLNHTNINPTGTNLQPGERVDIQGSFAGNGAINASTVNITGGRGGHYHHF